MGDNDTLTPLPPNRVFSSTITELQPRQVRVRGLGGKSAEADIVLPMLWNPSFTVNGQFEIQRTPTWIAHLDQTGVGPTALHTPAVNRSFRLMGFTVIFGCGLAAAGMEAVKLLDGAADIGADVSQYCPIAASVGSGATVTVNLPGNGILSTTAGNALNVTLGAAATAGAVSITAWGCDE